MKITKAGSRRSGPASAARGAEQEWPQRMGSTIRQLRQSSDLTLVELANRTGLSHSFLSQVERGLARPSMKSLFDIAQALGTTQDRLLGAAQSQDNSAVVLLRAGDGLVLGPTDTEGPPRGKDGVARQLTVEHGSFYPTEFTNLGHDFGEFWFQHEGIEFAYVATGVIEVELGDETVHTLRPGDSLRYPGRVPHRWRAKGKAATRVLMVHTGVQSNPLLPDE